ncbi:hypothetical protein M3Y96_00661200 [Aphelenchoides besseyi]|nr:hypothetical protein M3Y96_00661200 [Aphelenchoides besseyi]
MKLRKSLVLLIFFYIALVEALRFHVPSNEKKCLKEEIHRNIVLTGEYEFSEAIGNTASVHVTDTRGHTLYKRENFPDTKGKFAFTADEYDIFEICISVHSPSNQQKINREVSLVLKHGVEAKNYEDLAKAEKLKPLEVELRRLEDLSDSIVQDFAYMRQREEEMRTTNESTNNRVLYLSIFSMELVDPIRLPCQHRFCARCIGKSGKCAICDTTFDSTKLTVDRVLSYVIESSKEATETCANCDGLSQPMQFCETCQQPLCSDCVPITHSAKFFASHLISPLDERGRQRHSFVNIDVAHKICREKLDKSVILLRSFQDELFEQIDARKRLIIDLDSKYAHAEEKLLERYNSLVNSLQETKDEMLSEIRKNRMTRKTQLSQQLKALENIETIMTRKTEKISFNGNLDLDYDEKLNEVLRRDLDLHSSLKGSTLLRLNSLPSLGTRFSAETINNNGGLIKFNSRSTLDGLSVLMSNHTFDGNGAFAEQFQKIDLPLKQFSDETALLSKDLLGLQRDITFNQRMVDKKTVDELIQRCEEMDQKLRVHSSTVNEVYSELINTWNEQMEVLQKQQILVNYSAHELATLQQFTQQVLDTSKKLQPLTNFLSSVIQTIRPAAVEVTPPMEQICNQIVNLHPDSKQRVEAIEKEEEQRRIAREKEKRAGEEEARGLKKGLRETRKSKTRPISVLVVENNRDRNALVEQTISRKRQQRFNADLRTPSPRVFSSTTSLDASSSKTTELSSPISLSSCPLIEDAELDEKLESLTISTPAPLVQLTVDDVDNEITKNQSVTVATPSPPPKPRTPTILLDTTPSAETVQARNLLLQSIKDRVKRID